MPFWKFTLYTFLGCIPWTFALAYLGVLVEGNWERVLNYFDIPTLIIACLLVVLGGVFYVRRRRANRSF
jgi:membrane protein DedA with SNARE-associated domain